MTLVSKCRRRLLGNDAIQPVDCCIWRQSHAEISFHKHNDAVISHSLFSKYIFLFGIPEIIAPWIISMGNGLDFFGGDRPWAFTAYLFPVPLSVYSIVDSPSYMNARTTKCTFYCHHVDDLERWSFLLPFHSRSQTWAMFLFIPVWLWWSCRDFG